MSGVTSLKQAIVATLCEHPDAQKYHEQSFENVRDLVGALAQRVVLTKADFFAKDEAGKSFLDSAGAWKNFDKIAEIVALSGDRFTYDDFMQPVAGEKTLLDSAKSNGGLAKVFTFEVWKGHYEEMESLWYQLQAYERNKILTAPGGTGLTSTNPAYAMIPLDLKKRLYAFEGRVTPEERLAKAGLTQQDIQRAAVDNHAYDDVTRKLRLAGDYFRKEYALMLDYSGDTMFDGREGAWDRFEKIVSVMRAHGEQMEVSDYTRQVSNSRTLLARAAEKKALNKVFAPEQWAGRLPDMLKLWFNVQEAWKTAPMTTQDFDNAYAVAEDLTYGRIFAERNFEGKVDLLTRLNPEDDKPVIPLGLKTVWENFDIVQSHLRDIGEPITLQDLRQPSGHMGDSCLLIAAKYGCFDKIADVAKQSGEMITMDDFQSKDGHGNTLLNILAEKKQLSLVFTADAWAGHVADMKALWSMVGNSYRKQVDFSQVEIQAKQATLRQKKGGIRIRPN